MPAWQQVPPEATVSLEQLRQTTMDIMLPIAVLSYGWASKAHPDSTGEQLRSLIPVLRAMVQCCKDGMFNGGDRRPLVWGIVWDFMSLPQRGYTTGYDAKVDDRTPYQVQRFSKGLKAINIWYAAQHVTTLVLDLPMPEGAENAAPVERRGWCLFERQLSSITKHASCCLCLSRLDYTPDCWARLAMECQGARIPPPSPDAFEAEMRAGMAREEIAPGTGFRFTNGKDATNVCIPQYRQAYVRLMRGANKLDYSNCCWGDTEAASLYDALEWAHANDATTSASILGLRYNELTDAAVPRLVEVLSAGAIPELKGLYLDGNALSDAGLQLLQPLVAGRISRKLTKLGYGSRLTDYGVQTLVALVIDGHLANLEVLYLQDNQISDAGAQSLADALSAGKLPRLKHLKLSGNQIGDAGTETLARAVSGLSGGGAAELVLYL